MARKVNVLTVCDMHADGDIEATTTRSIVLDGIETEIDLCAADGEAFDEAITPWVDAGRRVSGRTRSRSARPTRGRPERDTKAIRDWARRNGHAVNERGRIPATVVNAYDAAA